MKTDEAKGRLKHRCPSCDLSAATTELASQLAPDYEHLIEKISDAHSWWLEEATDLEGCFYFLRDEVEEVLALAGEFPGRDRLVEALRLSRKPWTKDAHV